MARERGTLEDWIDHRGFGFIRRPDGTKIYVHMKSIGKSIDRPRVGDRFEYAVSAGKDGRPVATEVVSVSTPPPAPPPLIDARSNAPYTVFGVASRIVGAAVILCMLSVNIFMLRLPTWVAGLYLIGGCASALVYRNDKMAAIRKDWRRPEIRMHLVDLTFGIVGGLTAQHVFRHKTFKPSFVRITALITALHVLTLGLIMFGVYAPGSVGEFFRANFSRQ